LVSQVASVTTRGACGDRMPETCNAQDGTSTVVEEERILFAVPKKGRVYEEVSKLLKGSGMGFKRPERLDVALCKEMPVKLVFLPACDIPSYVMQGHVDLGISGSDMLEEALHSAKETGLCEHPLCDARCGEVKVLEKLGFGKCKLCVQAPVASKITDPSALVGKRIVTSFPHLSKQYFDKLQKQEGANGTKRTLDGSQREGEFNRQLSTGSHDRHGSEKTSIKVVSGSVEAACGLGLADGIVDLVETGATMHAAGLEVISDVIETEALLFQKMPTEQNGLLGRKGEIISLVLSRIQGYLTATKFVTVQYNCPTESLAKCCKITPGRRSPTITALQEEGWHAVSALVGKDKLNVVMDCLVQNGAQDVLCFDVVNTRM